MNAVVVVAGGSGQRMGSQIPKQYLDLGGKPLIIHTLEKFFTYDREMKVVLVMAKSHLKFWDVISISYQRGPGIVVALGGETRHESVKNGLQHIRDGLVVGIHDAVRPLVSLETISRCYEAAAKTGSGIPVVDMDDSVRMIRENGKSENLERRKLKRVQTPQAFRSEQIREAYNQACDPFFTDDASVYESLFGQVTLVEGNNENIKITTPADFRMASLII
ncbi:MAG: 2-C-methyl-D-erythritol 4-phosphate cytidylyltransferase [Bacteroidota bacterium]